MSDELIKKYNNKINQLLKHNKLYFLKSKPIISDSEYDKLKSEIIELENKYNFLNSKDSPSKIVGYKPSRILKLPIAYIVIQSYSGKGLEDQQGQLMFAREISSLAEDKDFNKVLLIDDLSDTGLTLNKSIDWLKNYGPTKNFIKEVKTACLWKKKSSTFEPDFCPVRLDSDPWIVQPTEHYEELDIKDIIEKNK